MNYRLRGIKTAISEREIRELKSIARNQCVIEVGSLMGFSTIHLADVATTVHAIDPHQGYPYYRPAATLATFRHNIQRFGVRNRVVEHVATAQSILPKLRGDLTFIDCTGFYGDTLFCLRNASGTIACHDFGRAGCRGVDRAVKEFVKDTRRNLRVVDTLAIIE